MIVWLASFPRSGNTFLRIAPHRLYGVRSQVVYDEDGVAERLGPELVGFEDRSLTKEMMRTSLTPHFIKTHRQRDEQIHEADQAICLVRDGRDALVSWARLLSENEPYTFENRLRAMITRDDPRGTGSWGANVLSWLRPAASQRIVVRFENLIAAPERTLADIMGQLSLDLRPINEAIIPTFADLKAMDGGFFRSGLTGAWRHEIPDQLHDLFWSKPDNREAMNLLGYS